MITDSESEEQFRASLRREKNRKKKRQRSGEDGGGDDSVPGNILVDLLQRISPLCEKLSLGMRQQLPVSINGAAAAEFRFFDFFQTSSAFGDPLDLSDHPLLLDIFSLGPPQQRTGLVSFQKHPDVHGRTHGCISNFDIT